MLNFNTIYWFYDLLAQLVFEKKLERAKVSLLDKIGSESNVLIIGGGTGSTLRYLDQLRKNLHVDFVEASSGMMHKAKCRPIENLRVSFYEMKVEEFRGGAYDFIITEFFFDMFSPSSIEGLIEQILPMLKPDGNWIDTDFRRTERLFYKLVLWIMYLFFRLTVNLKVSNLCDADSTFKKHRMFVKQEGFFVQRFITSRLIARS